MSEALFTVPEIAGRLDLSADYLRALIRKYGLAPAGVEKRRSVRLHDARYVDRRVYRLADVAALRGGVPPPGIDQRALAAALGKQVQSVRKWTREGMPCRRVGRFVRYDVDACRAWLAARPDKRQRRGRALNGGTICHPLAVGLELGMRDQLRRVAAEHDVSVSTLLREGARRVLAALGEPVEPPERLPHLLPDHPFRKAQMP